MKRSVLQSEKPVHTAWQQLDAQRDSYNYWSRGQSLWPHVQFDAH